MWPSSHHRSASVLPTDAEAVCALCSDVVVSVSEAQPQTVLEASLRRNVNNLTALGHIYTPVGQCTCLDENSHSVNAQRRKDFNNHKLLLVTAII